MACEGPLFDPQNPIKTWAGVLDQRVNHLLYKHENWTTDPRTCIKRMWSWTSVIPELLQWNGSQQWANRSKSPGWPATALEWGKAERQLWGAREVSQGVGRDLAPSEKYGGRASSILRARSISQHLRKLWSLTALSPRLWMGQSLEPPMSLLLLFRAQECWVSRDVLNSHGCIPTPEWLKLSGLECTKTNALSIWTCGGGGVLLPVFLIIKDENYHMIRHKLV